MGGRVYPTLLEVVADRTVMPVRNETRPHVGLDVSAGAADDFEWRCKDCGHQWVNRAQLPTGSTDRCRCKQCGREWEASVANRARRGAGCRRCSYEIISQKNRRTSIHAHSDQLACEFQRNVTRPCRTADTTAAFSHDRIEWKCVPGHIWTTSANQRAKMGTGCPMCAAGKRRSCFELEVGRLITAVAGLDVEFDVPVEVSLGRRKSARVDLYVPDLGLYIDLDSWWWHSKKRSVERDVRKTAAMAGFDYVRFRSSRSPAIDAVAKSPKNSDLTWPSGGC